MRARRDSIPPIYPQGRLFVYCKSNPRHKQRQGRGPRRKLHTLGLLEEEQGQGMMGGLLKQPQPQQQHTHTPAAAGAGCGCGGAHHHHHHHHHGTYSRLWICGRIETGTARTTLARPLTQPTPFPDTHCSPHLHPPAAHPRRVDAPGRDGRLAGDGHPDAAVAGGAATGAAARGFAATKGVIVIGGGWGIVGKRR